MDGHLPISRYTLGADIGQGTGASPSAASGIDGSKGLKVLEYLNANLKPHEFAELVVALCGMMHGVVLGSESAGPTGETFCDRIMELGYRNVYRNEDEIMWKRRSGSEDKPGWYPSNKAKLKLLLEYMAAIYEKKLVNRSAIENALRKGTRGLPGGTTLTQFVEEC